MAKKKKPIPKKPPYKRKSAAKLKKLLFVLLVAYGAYFMWQQDPPGPNPLNVSKLPPITAAPQMTKLALPWPYQHRGFELMPVAEYMLTARVLDIAKHDDKFAQVAPYSIVVGWGKMSDQRVAAALQVNIQGRYYSFERSPSLSNFIDEEKIRHNMANMYLIPYDATVQRFLDTLQPGMQVSLIGYLVNAKRNKLRLRTSTSLSDAGPGGSEVMLVQRVVVH